MLSWNANTEPDLAGYKLYYDTVPHAETSSVCSNAGYANSIDVGNVTTYTIDTLVDGTTYYFALSSYDTSKNESGCSIQLSKTTAPGSSIDSAVLREKIKQTQMKIIQAILQLTKLLKQGLEGR